MSIQPLTSGGFFRSVSILHFALMLGMTLFAVVSALTAMGDKLAFKPLSSEDNIFAVILAVILIGGQVMTRPMINRQVESLKKEPQLKAKLEGFRSICIMQYAMLEGPGLFAIVAVMLSGNAWFYAAAALCLLGLFLLRPTPDRAVAVLGLGANDQAVVYDPGAVIE